MLVSTLLVIMMAVPGLALFYGGLVRSKNMLSVLMQVFVTFSMIVVLWVVYGYSLAFTEGNAFVGGFDRLFLKGVFDPATGRVRDGGHLQQGRGHPRDRVRRLPGHLRRHHLLPDRRRLRRAHQVQRGAAVHGAVVHLQLCADRAHGLVLDGPDAYTSKEVVDAMNAKAGLIWQWGALDFAGGTVVHINAAVAGLVGAYMIGKRVGYGKESMAPHSLTLTMVGASLLWVGWFGFNAGSALEAGNSAALAFLNTFSATAAAVLAWCIGEALMKGKASMLGAASGAVAGLVAITPACGNVGIVGAMVIGFVAGFACLWGVNGLKKHARRRRLARRVRRARRRRHRRCAADRRVQQPGAGRPGPGHRLGHRLGRLQRRLRPGADPGQGRRC
jgi:Amt family ammonium transporter